MICALTGSRRLELIISKEEGDGIDMCKAIEEWEEISKQARNEGRLEGERRGQKRGERKQILQFIQEMLEKGYTDEMILGFKSVTKQLLKHAKLSH